MLHDFTDVCTRYFYPLHGKIDPQAPRKEGRDHKGTIAGGDGRDGVHANADLVAIPEDDGYGSQTDDSTPPSPAEEEPPGGPWAETGHRLDGDEPAPIRAASPPQGPATEAGAEEFRVWLANGFLNEYQAETGVKFTALDLMKPVDQLPSLFLPSDGAARAYPQIVRIASTTVEQAHDRVEAAARRCRKPKIDLPGAKPIKGFNVSELALDRLRSKSLGSLTAWLNRTCNPYENRAQIEHIDKFAAILECLADADEALQETLRHSGTDLGKRKNAISSYFVLVDAQVNSLKHLASTMPRSLLNAPREGSVGILSKVAGGVAAVLGLFSSIPFFGIGATVVGVISNIMPDANTHVNLASETRNAFWDALHEMVNHSAEALAEHNESSRPKIRPPIHGPQREWLEPSDPAERARLNKEAIHVIRIRIIDVLKEGVEAADIIHVLMTGIDSLLDMVERKHHRPDDNIAATQTLIEQKLVAHAAMRRKLAAMLTDVNALLHAPVTGAVLGAVSQACENVAAEMKMASADAFSAAKQLDTAIKEMKAAAHEGVVAGTTVTMPEDADDDIFFDCE